MQSTDETRCPYCCCFFPTKEINRHKQECHDRPAGR